MWQPKCWGRLWRYTNFLTKVGLVVFQSTVVQSFRSILLSEASVMLLCLLQQAAVVFAEYYAGLQNYSKQCCGGIDQMYVGSELQYEKMLCFAVEALCF